MISIIAAMTKHRVIGNKGKLPWHLPAELAYFKKMTLGKPVLMGRRTYESIGHPLPHRRTLVLTQQKLLIPGCEVYASLAEVWSSVSEPEELMVIGGAILFQQTLPLAQRLYLTIIDCDLPGDAYFPDWNPAEWREVHSQFHPADSNNRYAFRTILLERSIPR